MTVVLTPLADMAPVPRVEMVVESADVPVGTNRVTLWRVADGREFKVRGGVDRVFAGGPPLEVRRNVDIDPAATGTTVHSGSQSGAGSPTFTATSTPGMNVGGMGIDTFVRVEATTASTYLDVRGTLTNNTLKTPLGPDISASAWVRASTIGDPVGRVYLQQYNSSNTLLGTTDVAITSIGSGWNRIGISAPRMAGASKVVAIFRLTGTVPVGGRLDVTGFLTESSATVGRWFSGASTAYLGYVPSWLGSANASASIESAGTGSLSLIDYEPPLRGSFAYEAECWAGDAPLGRVALGSTTIGWSGGTVIQQPLDPSLAVQATLNWGTADRLTRSTPGELVFSLGSTTPDYVGFGPRRALQGVNLSLEVADEDMEMLHSTLGTYEVQQLPVWLVRSTMGRWPAVFFCHVGTLSEVDRSGFGGGVVGFDLTVDEVSPPVPALVISVLSYMDLDASFASYTAMDNAYASYDQRDRDYSLAGATG